MNKGFSTLFAIIIVAATGLTVVLTLSLLSVSSSRISNNLYNSNRARSLANACVMQGLMLVRNNINFTGTGSISIDGQTCDYTIINTGGDNREIRGQSTIKETTRKTKAFTNVSGAVLTLSNWQETADF